ncbi:hypothetical protein KQI76_00415 [Amphibacillus sp. MSJ-3]|uniref:hypothetical protein n=1 Tax=Amphibacillus sp. MSJ-3 TaxID=2841505 RepID=UPI001C0F0930|nr:hypothetical protein [Amphibacillus sp. MSJ-3]MBU5593620.1 hypothetical protein [Amphibacillus sp. MSJ-3]
MEKGKEGNQHLNSNKKATSSKTNPEKVRQEIQRDIEAGQGAMTSREAGGMRE